jgi:hypothetical protein
MKQFAIALAVLVSITSSGMAAQNGTSNSGGDSQQGVDCFKRERAACIPCCIKGPPARSEGTCKAFCAANAK